MKCEVKLFVAGKVFSEEVHARDYNEARQVAVARNFECAMIYIQKGIKKEKNARSKLNRKK